MQDFYEILQVSPNAEQEVIESAYKRLALKYHPDRSGDASTRTKMAQLGEAYETLRDSTKRSAYDSLLKARAGAAEAARNAAFDEQVKRATAAAAAAARNAQPTPTHANPKAQPEPTAQQEVFVCKRCSKAVSSDASRCDYCGVYDPVYARGLRTYRELRAVKAWPLFVTFFLVCFIAGLVRGLLDDETWIGFLITVSAALLLPTLVQLFFWSVPDPASLEVKREALRRS